MEKNIGYLAFIGAMVIAVLGAMITLDPGIMLLSLVLGVVVGVLNIDKAESLPFMVASLVLGGGLTVLNLPSSVQFVSLILKNVGAVALAAGSTVALIWIAKHASK